MILDLRFTLLYNNILKKLLEMKLTYILNF